MTREEYKAQLVIEAINADATGLSRWSSLRDQPRQKLFELFLGELGTTNSSSLNDYRAAWDATYLLIRAFKALGVKAHG